MKDFITIFLGLSIGVGGFMAGRNYGEKTYRETTNFKDLVKANEELKFTRAELETVKTKFQNIIDGADNKKQEELLAQILQVFLADLGLTVANQQVFQIKPVVMAVKTELLAPAKALERQEASEKPVAKETKPEKQFDYKRLKSYEWILANSSGTDEIKKNLKNVEVKNLDLLLKNSTQPPAEKLESIFGTYRGRIIDINKKEYGSLAVQIFPQLKPDAEMLLKGSIKIFKNGQEQSSKSFLTNRLAYQAQDSAGFFIDNGSQFYQVYKITETQQLTGFMYERMVQGTTKTIGTFVLNRTDQF